VRFKLSQLVPDENMVARLPALRSKLLRARPVLIELATACSGTHARFHEEDFSFMLEYLDVVSRPIPAEPHIRYRARGTVLLGLSKNEPLVVGLVPLLSALFTDNEVIVRPSRTLRPFMDEVISILVEGRFPTVTTYCAHEEIKDFIARADFICWLGSYRTCSAIALECARQGKPYVLESEGNDLAIFFEGIPDAMRHRYIKFVTQSLVRHDGQACQAVRGIFVPRAEEDGYVGLLNEILSESFSEHGGTRPEFHRLADQDAPTEPFFGPRLWVKSYGDVEDILEIAGPLNYGLSLALYTPDASHAALKRLAESIPTARFFINCNSGETFPSEPWGGIGKSGMTGVESWLLRFVTKTHFKVEEGPLQVANYLYGGRNALIPFTEGYPQTITRADGPFVFDQTGARYVDLWMGFGAQLLGHGDVRFGRGIYQTAGRLGSIQAYHHDGERELAARVHAHVSCAEKVRFAVSGQEATAYAVRMARAHTKREQVIVMEGGYHGANDSLGYRSPAGLPRACLDLIRRVEFNDIKAVRRELATRNFAAVILEPVMGNCTVIAPQNDYLQTLRSLCDETGTVLIFDEIMTGLRANLGGAQADLGVTPDLALFGKALAGGLPLSVICGRERFMSALSSVAHEGTFCGNPLAVYAAIELIDELVCNRTIEQIATLANEVLAPARNYVEARSHPVAICNYGGMFSFFFGRGEVRCAKDVMSWMNERAFAAFRDHLCASGYLYPPIPTEAAFLCLAHATLREPLARVFVEAVEHASTFLVNHV
jgi:glutamate-1-semialdehyde 2,1-aminomutase